MIGGMQGHQNGDAAWHREQLGHKSELEKANETIAELTKQRDELAEAVKEAIKLRVSSWRNGDFDGDDDHLPDDVVAMKDHYAKKWVPLIASVKEKS